PFEVIHRRLHHAKLVHFITRPCDSNGNNSNPFPIAPYILDCNKPDMLVPCSVWRKFRSKRLPLYSLGPCRLLYEHESSSTREGKRKPNPEEKARCQVNRFALLNKPHTCSLWVFAAGIRRALPTHAFQYGRRTSRDRFPLWHTCPGSTIHRGRRSPTHF